MSQENFALQISPDAVQNKHSLIFLAGLLLDTQEQLLPIRKENDNRYAEKVLDKDVMAKVPMSVSFW